MAYKLTKEDYMAILRNYKKKNKMQKTRKSIPSRAERKTVLQSRAKKIMASKMCRCVKRIKDRNESKAIRICTKTLFQNRGMTRGKFKCSPSYSVEFQKTKKNRKVRFA